MSDQDQAVQAWHPVSDRKVRVGIVGYGVCGFGAAFGFQDHPNVEVVAVADLNPEARAKLAEACRCGKTFESAEAMLQDDIVEAVFIATDAPSHARLSIAALRSGKHVASTVPAVFGSLDDAQALNCAVKETGLKYMMFETSCFHVAVHSMRQMYQAGDLGRIIYAEGEYYHYFAEPMAAYGHWRTGLVPQWYPTHAMAYYVGVTDGSFTEVSCAGVRSELEQFKPENNRYANPFGTEIALLRTGDGAAARMVVSWDTPGSGGEQGRIRAENGSFDRVFRSVKGEEAAPVARPPLPPRMARGDHGGSHGYLTDEFIEAILLDRTPLVHVAQALNMTVAGIVAHQSALRDGELMKIPQFNL